MAEQLTMDFPLAAEATSEGNSGFKLGAGEPVDPTNIMLASPPAPCGTVPAPSTAASTAAPSVERSAATHSIPRGAKRPTTLRACLEHATAQGHVSATELTDMRGAVSRLEKIVQAGAALTPGTAPVALPVRPEALRPILNNVMPALHRISLSRWRNIRSAITSLLIECGWVCSTARSSAPVTGAWAVLLHRAGDNKSAKPLLPFARYCAARNLGPEDATALVLRDYEEWRRQRTLTANPRGAAQKVKSSWNLLAKAAPDLGLALLRTESRVWALRPEQWPKRNGRAWQSAQQSRGRLSQAGPAAALAADTREMMAEAYGTYLAWLAETGKLDPAGGPADRLTFERLAAFLAARRRTCSDNTVFNNLRMLKMALACMVPGQNWGWVCHHPAGPLRHEAQAARKKPLVFNPGGLMNVLCHEMDALMQAPAGRAEAVRFRNCLLVATAALTGLRRRNLLERAVIYTRYSSDNQRDASIDDQIRICRERVAAEGWDLVQVFRDAAISGATTLRRGYQARLEGAREAAFDVVVAEALDRLSHDREDVAALFKRLQYTGTRLITLGEGEISALHVGLKGTMNALFLKDLAAKVGRGLRGRVDAGKFGPSTRPRPRSCGICSACSPSAGHHALSPSN